MNRLNVVQEARTWVGTPYHHQARLKGVGVDCIGLEIGAGWELGSVPRSFDVTGYPKEADGVTLLRLARLHLTEVTKDLMQFGDIIVTATQGIPHHFGILVPYRHGGFSVIHAHREYGVVETRLMYSPVMQFAAAFLFPGIG